MGKHFLVEKSKAIHDKALYDHAFRNLTVGQLAKCMIECYKHCLCVAFQICNETECQLLSNNRFLKPISLMTLMGCSYYDMIPIQTQVSNLQFYKTVYSLVDFSINSLAHERIFAFEGKAFPQVICFIVSF